VLVTVVKKGNHLSAHQQMDDGETNHGMLTHTLTHNRILFCRTKEENSNTCHNVGECPFFKTGSCYRAYAGLKLHDPPASASQVLLSQGVR
jgi:hypothetical protein